MINYCGINTTQQWTDLYLWEELLNDYPDIDAIFELGTAYGGMSLFLKHQSDARGIAFYTFDNVDHSCDPIDQHFGRPGFQRKTPNLDENFTKMDVLERPSGWMIGDQIKRSKQPILFCDNGHKAKEVELYEPCLPEGGFLVVHDWLTEIFPADIPSHLRPLDKYHYNTPKMTRFFQK